MKPVRDYAILALDQIVRTMESNAIATNKCPGCGGPFPCPKCHRAALDRIDAIHRELLRAKRERGEPV